MPDLFCCHSHHKIRLIEVKDPLRKGELFTPAQMETFPKLCANGAPVYVLMGANESEYKKLWEPENWYTFLQLMRR